MDKTTASEVMDRLRRGMVVDLRMVADLLAHDESYCSLTDDEHTERCEIEYLCHSIEEDGTELDMLGHLLQSDCADRHQIESLQTGIRFGYCVALD